MDKKTSKRDKTVDFDKLMNNVRFVDTPVGGIYLLQFDGMRARFKDTDEVIPYMNDHGYVVTLNGEEV
jgi:hypothetical protein